MNPDNTGLYENNEKTNFHLSCARIPHDSAVSSGNSDISLCKSG